MEFTLKSAKIVESMKDLTEHEIQLFRQYLQKDWGVVENFFEGDDWMSDDFRVMYWGWQGQTLIDMHGWPGDNEDGAIFLNDQVVILNGDQSLGAVKNIPDELEELLDDFQHIRRFDCRKHLHCCEHYKQYNRWIPGGNFDLFKLNEWRWTPDEYSNLLEVSTNSDGQEIVTVDEYVILVDDQPTPDCPPLFLLDLESWLHIKTFSCSEVGHIHCGYIQRRYKLLKSQQ